jgi:hypothetical protein
MLFYASPRHRLFLWMPTVMGVQLEGPVLCLWDREEMGQSLESRPLSLSSQEISHCRDSLGPTSASSIPQ